MTIRNPQSLMGKTPDTALSSRHTGDALGLRVLIYSHDTYGLGHFRRCLKIARQFAGDRPNCSALILTGSPLADRYPLPDGVDTVKLPAVIKTGREQYESRSARLPLADLTHLRAEIIRTTAEAFAPDVVLIDHAPVGLKGEALAMLDMWEQRPYRPQLILGLRDIIDDPEIVVPLWKSEGVYDAIERLYDRIFVYGMRTVFDPTVAYSFPPALTSKTTFVGYVCDSGPGMNAGDALTIPSEQPVVAVTVGGGEDGQHIVDTFLSMIEAAGPDVGFHTVLLPGPLLSEPVMSALQARVADLPVQLEPFVADIAPLLQRADVVVAMGGYNTVSEILCHARRAVLVPRETPRREQLIRARVLQDRGIVRVLRPGDLTPDALADAIRSELATGTGRVSEARERGCVELGGAERIVSEINPVAHLTREVGNA